MKPTKRLIVLANAAVAEVYTYDSKGAKLQLLREISHPSSALMNREIISDEPGAYNHYETYNSRTDPKELEAEKFATSLAHEIDKHAEHSKEIFILAPAHFHPMVKNKLKKTTQDKVTKYFDKDYTKLGIKNLEKHLSKLLNIKF